MIQEYSNLPVHESSVWDLDLSWSFVVRLLAAADCQEFNVSKT